MMIDVPPIPTPRKSKQLGSATIESIKAATFPPAEKKNVPSRFNPFMTLHLPGDGPQASLVILECGHKFVRLYVQGKEVYQDEECTIDCERKCSRGHRCPIKHPCGEPCDPCLVETKISFECGHSIMAPCHQVGTFQNCQLFCERPRHCGHVCKKLCSEKCGPCLEMVMQRFPDCHHRYSIQCSLVGRELPVLCPLKVKASIIPDCGHLVTVKCPDRTRFTTDALSDMCGNPCSREDFEYGGCGHPCHAVCSSCQNGVFHKRCKQPCGRNLICGHVCVYPCSKNCPPCNRECLTSCEHGSCIERCGKPCPPCKLPCKWNCPHHECTKTCDEICDREPCTSPCPEILDCGHSCVGFCGEPCPDLCRYCNPSKLLEGMFDGRTTIEAYDRFIRLTDCGHVFEVGSLDQWMKVEGEDGEITMKTCPLCRAIIWKCRRYHGILRQKRQRLNEVKTKIFGSDDEIRETQVQALGALLDINNSKGGMFKEFRSWLIRHLSVVNDEDDEPVLLPMNLVTAKCLQYVTERLNISEKLFARLDREYETEEFNVMEYYYRENWRFIRSRGIPLTQTEQADLERQFTRAEDMAMLMDRKLNDIGPGFANLYRTPGAIDLYDDAYSIIAMRAGYTKTLRDEFLANLAKLDKALRCQLGITDRERQMIVAAFGSCVGRWFKCPNGHIYVVTECGGPTEVGVCNECGLSVGGTNHAAVEDNQLAVEMDGATVPLYPTALLGLQLEEVADFMLEA